MVNAFFAIIIIFGCNLFADYKLSKNARIINSRDFEINEGDIIVNVFEDGELLKVVRRDDQLYLEKASMEEAFEYLNVSYSYTLDPEDVKNELFSLKGVSLEKKENKFRLVFNNFELLDYDLDSNTKDDKILVNGYVEFSIDGSWDIRIEKNLLKELNFFNSFDQKSDIEILFSTPIRVSIPFSKDFLIAEYELSPIDVGPVVFRPVVSFVAGFNVGIAGSLKVNLKNSFNGFYKIDFVNGRWSYGGNLHKKEQNGYLSFVGADGWIKAYIGPKVKIKFYDVLGPYMESFGFVKSEVKTVTLKPLTMKWSLYGGFDLNAGVSAKIFSFALKDFERNIYRYEKEIITGNYPIRDFFIPDLFELETNHKILNSSSMHIINSGKW